MVRMRTRASERRGEADYKTRSPVFSPSSSSCSQPQQERQAAGEESQALDWLPNLCVGIILTIMGLRRGKAAPGTFASYKYSR